MTLLEFVLAEISTPLADGVDYAPNGNSPRAVVSRRLLGGWWVSYVWYLRNGYCNLWGGVVDWRGMDTTLSDILFYLLVPIAIVAGPLLAWRAQHLGYSGALVWYSRHPTYVAYKRSTRGTE